MNIGIWQYRKWAFPSKMKKLDWKVKDYQTIDYTNDSTNSNIPN
jgi:hypothetical protein